jgi:hypothetical protein
MAVIMDNRAGVPEERRLPRPVTSRPWSMVELYEKVTATEYAENDKPRRCNSAGFSVSASLE